MLNINQITTESIIAEGYVLNEMANQLLKDSIIDGYGMDVVYEAAVAAGSKEETNEPVSKNGEKSSSISGKIVSTIKRIWAWIKKCLKNFCANFNHRYASNSVYKEAVVDNSDQLEFLRAKYKDITFNDNGLITETKNVHLSDVTVKNMQKIHSFNYNSTNKVIELSDRMTHGAPLMINSVESSIKAAGDAATNLHNLVEAALNEQKKQTAHVVNSKVNANLFSALFGIVFECIDKMNEKFANMDSAIATILTSLNSYDERYKEKVENCKSKLLTMSKEYQSSVLGLQELYKITKAAELMKVYEFKWDLVYGKNQFKTGAREEFKAWKKNGRNVQSTAQSKNSVVKSNKTNGQKVSLNNNID